MLKITLKRFLFFIIPALGLIVFLDACKEDPEKSKVTISSGATPYYLNLPASFPKMPIPLYNPLTVEGVALGKKLFYDPLLSDNNKQSCASCHQQKASFVDSSVKFSKGSSGVLGFRNSMPIFNIGYANAWFWDGKVTSLEAQVFHPVTSRFEMNQDPQLLVDELSSNKTYVQMFNSAFGEGKITFEKTSMAIAQFMRSIIAYTPKPLDTMLMTAGERRGLKVFLNENKGDCFHCHELGNFMTNFKFADNGLNLNAVSDPGLYGVTGKGEDIGKFKTPALINLKYTAPYMHDGRFKTLREVIDFYDTGFHYNPLTNPNLDPNLIKHFDKTTGKPEPRKWTEQDKLDIIEFLEGLVDESVIYSPLYR